MAQDPKRQPSSLDRYANLSPRQKRVIEIVAENPTISWQEACGLAGYSTKGNLWHVKKRLEGVLGHELYNAGITRELIAEKIAAGINATKLNITKIPKYEKGKDGRKRLTAYDIHKHEEPDFSTQLAYLKFAAMLAGLNPKFQVEHEHGPQGHLHIHASLPKEIDLVELAQREQELIQQVENGEDDATDPAS